MFFYAENLTKQTVQVGLAPWDFKVTEIITAQIRGDKKARQEWYKTASTKHYFYTGIESSNPNGRPSKENPPRFIHAFAADYDVKIPDSRVKEAIAAMDLKPSYFERSLGGNVRLVWILPKPLLVDGYDYCAFVCEKAIKWLNLEMLPGLDEGAFKTPTRMLCNGGVWEKVEGKGISEDELQSFNVICSKAFNFVDANALTIPLDVVEAELKVRFPNFSWPSEFAAETMGPSFWIPEATSPTSAWLKPEGFISFSAHATKKFYSWSMLLGGEFIANFQKANIARATSDIWYDSKKFWRKKRGDGGKDYWVSMEDKELTSFLRVNCRLSPKPGPSGESPIAEAFAHIYCENHVVGAAPFVMRQGGLISHMGNRILNTYMSKVVQPATEKQEWGVNFPLLAEWFKGFLEPELQLDHLFAWQRYAYKAALESRPLPGQNIFLMGPAKGGKTLYNREILGGMMGQFVDATSHLIKGETFNSEMYSCPMWCIDDEAPGESENSRGNFRAMLKKTTANSTFKYHKKFEVPVSVEWTGRVGCTSNLDYVSSRVLGSMDNTSRDKTSLFRCNEKPTFVFPDRETLIATIKRELPYFLRWLLDWEPPATVLPDNRYGYASYHEPRLLEQATQGGSSAPFKELLIEGLLDYFEMHPTETEWRGSVSKLHRMLHANPMNDSILRTLKMEHANRYLESIQREGIVGCTTETGVYKERVWVFTNPTIKKP